MCYFQQVGHGKNNIIVSQELIFFELYFNLLLFRCGKIYKCSKEKYVRTVPKTRLLFLWYFITGNDNLDLFQPLDNASKNTTFRPLTGLVTLMV